VITEQKTELLQADIGAVECADQLCRFPRSMTTLLLNGSKANLHADQVDSGGQRTFEAFRYKDISFQSLHLFFQVLQFTIQGVEINVLTQNERFVEMVFDGRELEQQPVGIGHCLLALVIEEVLTNAKQKDKGQKNQNRGGNSKKKPLERPA
jgi:hypothetical protein